MSGDFDVTASENKLMTNKRYWNNGTLAANLGSSNPPGVQSHRKRKPSLGRRSKLPVEKSFLYLQTEIVYPQGDLQVQTGGSTYNVYSGNLNLSTVAQGGSFSPVPCWPPSYNGETVKYQYDGINDPGVNPDLLSQAEVKALNKLRDKSGQTQLDFGLWYGERRETCNLFAGAARGLGDLAKAIARKNLSESARVLKDAFNVAATPAGERARVKRLERMLKREGRRGLNSTLTTLRNMEDAVLAYNLGVSPLLKDVQAAHQRLQTGDLTSLWTVKSVARHSNTENGFRQVRRDSGKTTCDFTMALTHGYTVTLLATPSFSEAARISRAGLANPLSLGYQLTSLTFIVDYFVALGPYLEAINAPMEFHFRDGSYTQRFILRVTSKATSLAGSTSTGVYSVNYTNRKVYTKFPVPIPPLSLKGTDLKAKQALNTGLIALKSFRALIGK